MAKALFQSKTAMPDMSVMCAGLLLPWSGGNRVRGTGTLIRDLMNALMAIPNLISLLLLCGVIVHETKKYEGEL